MRKHIVLAGILILVLSLVLSSGLGLAELSEGSVVDVQVSPNVFNISYNGWCATVHADIQLSEVDRDSVTLQINGDEVEVDKIFADDRGDLVAKVESHDVKAVVEGQSEATLTIDGQTKVGETFGGTDTFEVIECPSP